MSLKQLILVAVFICGLCFKTSVVCSADKNSNVTVFSSIKQLQDAGSNTNTATLVLRNSENEPLQTLKNDVFKKFPNLRLLTIEGVTNKLEEFAFRGLEKELTLKLVNNDINELPENIFKNLNLIHIEIINSKLKSIPAKCFFKMNDLRNIDLSNNSISTIGECAFCDLEKTIINLSNNSLKEFKSEIVLGTKSHILGIHLDHNHLTAIPHFGQMDNLRSATFVKNSIEKFEDGCFKFSPKLMYLDVSFNKLKVIPVKALPETIRNDEPFYLAINNNKIHCLSEEIRSKFIALRRIVVNDNPWQCECLEQIEKWSKKLNAEIGCDWPNDCIVGCTDSKNVPKNITFN